MRCTGPSGSRRGFGALGRRFRWPPSAVVVGFVVVVRIPKIVINEFRNSTAGGRVQTHLGILVHDALRLEIGQRRRRRRRARRLRRHRVRRRRRQGRRHCRRRLRRWTRWRGRWRRRVGRLRWWTGRRLDEGKLVHVVCKIHDSFEESYFRPVHERHEARRVRLAVGPSEEILTRIEPVRADERRVVHCGGVVMAGHTSALDHVRRMARSAPRSGSSAASRT